MSKIVSFLGETEDGGFVMDLELHPKRISSFKPFELERYEKVIKFIDSKYSEINKKERFELIDSLLYSESNKEKQEEFNKWGKDVTSN